MNRIIGILFCAFLIIVSTQAQTVQDVFDKGSELTYLGIDFTRVKIVGEPTSNTEDIVERQFLLINQKFQEETKKFNLPKVFKKSRVPSSIGEANKRNATIDPDQLLSEDTYDYQRLTPEDVTEVVKQYDFEGKTGTGLLLVAEGYNKTLPQISVYVTFIDMGTKSVIFTERTTAKLGSGFTYANYWLSGFKNLLDNIEKKELKTWKAKHKA